jgi:large subunit ribosomal protein L10
MTRQEKASMIDYLKEQFDSFDFFYLTDASTMSVAEVNDFREKCFELDVEMKVVKNKLAIKAIEALDGEDRKLDDIIPFLKGPTAILFTETANSPARIMKDFREEHDRPILKAAYIQADIYEGDDSIKPLSELKSKEELLADVIALLQSPAKNVISSLKSGGQTIAGLVKALQERADAES